jgi:phage tail sheath protein FI
MPVIPTYPGVYVQEVPSGVRTIVGVSTSVCLFMGRTAKGALFEPVEILSYTDFTNVFGSDETAGQLTTYVKLFFLNGGTDCWVMRIANGAGTSTVTLLNEIAQPVLVLTAKDEGAAGESIRAIVDYNTLQPEAAFNIQLFRWQVDSSGNRVRTGIEAWTNLSMDPNSPLYAVDTITNNSKLVDAALPGAMPPLTPAFSLSGRIVNIGGGFQAAWQQRFGTTQAGTMPPGPNQFQISVGGSPYAQVSLAGVVVTASPATTAMGPGSIGDAIESRFAMLGIPNIQVQVDFVPGPIAATQQLRIARRNTPLGASNDIYIRPGDSPDLAVPLMLGTAQGGIEISSFSRYRPAPNGITYDISELTGAPPLSAEFNELGAVLQGNWTGIQLPVVMDTLVPGVLTVPLTAPPPPPNVITTAAGQAFIKDNYALPAPPNNPPNNNNDGIREKLAIIVNLINSYVPPPPPPPAKGYLFLWKASTSGYRLTLTPSYADDNFFAATNPATGFDTPGAPALFVNRFTNNVQMYSLGQAGNNVGGFQQNPGTAATDGNAPVAVDYDTAYQIAKDQIDLFNLMVLPPDAAGPITDIYPNASVFCQSRRAFLIMDPMMTGANAWTDFQKAAAGVAAVRIGVSKQYSAIYYPRLMVDVNGLRKPVGPAGAMAGLYARTDSTRGVWKAPAGTQADLRGATGVEYLLSDPSNGVINPRGVNAIRAFPEGIVSWGARTNDGDDNFASEYKYIPIRRLALYLEESLYRGLKWVVFEPNDEPLWAQIRLNVGAFMHNLFRQGAFQGTKPSDAYFVKCDGETTTQNDRNLGIVNIWVGFAPLKPAEFVILYLQQMAGQIEV